LPNKDEDGHPAEMPPSLGRRHRIRARRATSLTGRAFIDPDVEDTMQRPEGMSISADSHPDRGAQSRGAGRPAAASPVYSTTKQVVLEPRWLRNHRVVADTATDTVAEAYKILRTQVLQRLRLEGLSTLGITATRQGNGKTLTALNLAISLAAEANQTVLLVDLDLRRPSLGRYLTEQPLLGISDYLTGRHDISEILINPGIERLVILPGNESLVNSSEQLSGPRMVQLVEELKARYADRIVLFDLPPLFVGDDLIAFAPHLDALMLVLEEGSTTGLELRRAYELLDGHKIIGTVLNKSIYNVGPMGYGGYGGYGGYRY
jgi:protein-tyrosine kinase